MTDDIPEQLHTVLLSFGGNQDCFLSEEKTRATKAKSLLLPRQAPSHYLADIIGQGHGSGYAT